MSLCMQKVKVGCGLQQGASLWEDGAGAERGRQNTGEGEAEYRGGGFRQTADVHSFT